MTGGRESGVTTHVKRRQLGQFRWHLNIWKDNGYKSIKLWF